jgi:hypothetical protein
MINGRKEMNIVSQGSERDSLPDSQIVKKELLALTNTSMSVFGSPGPNTMRMS